MPDSPHTADIVELVARLTALTNELDTHGDKDDASAVRAAITALEVADTRQDRGSNSGGRKTSPNSKATKAMRDTPTEAMIAALERIGRAKMLVAWDHGPSVCYAAETRGIALQALTAMQAARPIDQQEELGRSALDYYHDSTCPCVSFQRYVEDCPKHGNRPRSETPEPGPTAPVQDDDVEWLTTEQQCKLFGSDLVDLLRREGRHSSVWFADQLLLAADIIEQQQLASRLSPTPDTGLIEALTAIRDYSPEESKDGSGPYTQIAMFARSTARTALANAAPAQVESGVLKKRYDELIFAVGKKYEGETRHETALRYILEREDISSESASRPNQATKGDGQ